MPVTKKRPRPRLTKKEQAYCRCIMHVAPKRVVNPYAICMKSVYKGAKPGRKINCFPWYKFSQYNVSELRAYARMHKLSTTGTKAQLVARLNLWRKRKMK